MTETPQHKTPIERLLDAISDPDATLTPAIVDEIDKAYPYFTLADAILLQRSGSTLDSDTRRRLSERLALNAPDPDALFRFIDPQHHLWANFYPKNGEQSSTPSTDDAIDTFLKTYGHSDPSADALLEKLIFNPPAPDYMTLLETEQDPALKELSKPDPMFPDISGLQSRPVAENQTTSQSTEIQAVEPNQKPIQHQAEPSSSLSESLAKIYIRQHRYDKAYEIIHALSLNNPKKSIYFADQLRFLRKLIINQQTKK